MCRILFVQNPKEFIEKHGENKVTEYLSYLERRNGGHGNGIGGLTVYRGKTRFIIRKGLGLTHKETVKMMKKNKWVNGILWHTRLASSGTIESIHNHPHTDLDNILILVHNGHISNADDYLRAMKLFDPRYEKYSYDTYYYTHNYHSYKTYMKNNKKKNQEVTDTWILANLIAMMIKHGITSKMKLDDIMIIAYEKLLNHDAVILQLFSGTVYMLIAREDYEWVYDEQIGTIGASEGLYYLGYKKFYRGSGVVKIKPNKKPEIIYGEFEEENLEEEYERPKNDVLTTYHTTDYKLIMKLYKKCMNICLEAYGDDGTVCGKVCREIAVNADNEKEVEIMLNEKGDEIVEEINERHIKYLFNDEYI